MFRRTTRRTARPCRPARLPLRLERLEDRTVPSNYRWTDSGNGNWNNPNNWVVTSGTDGGFPNAVGDSAFLGSAISSNSTITIPDGITITVGSITIDDGNNYTIAAAGTGRLRFNAASGNAVLQVFNLSGNGSHTISAPITLVDNLEVTVLSTAPLNIIGPIAFSLGTQPGLGMTGPGTLRLGGSADNTYTGATTVRSGTLELIKTGGADAFRGNLIVGDGLDAASGAVVRNQQNENIPNGSTVTINSDGRYDLSTLLGFGGYTEQFGPLTINAGRVDVGGGMASFQTLTMTGGSLTTTAAGVIELLGNATINASATSATMTGTGELKLGFGSPHTFTVADGDAGTDLNISLKVGATVSPGLASLTKDGPGTMRLGGSGTFIGDMTLTAGNLVVGNDTALGTGTFRINGGTILAVGGARNLANNVIIGGDFTVGGGSEALTFNGTASLTGDRTITIPPGNSTTFAGLIAGGGLTKAGLGSLRLSGSVANTYTGLTKVAEGTLLLSKGSGIVAVAAFAGNLEVGDGVSGPAMVYHEQGNNIPDAATVTIRTDGEYRLFNHSETLGSLVVNEGLADAGTGTLIISALSMTGGELAAATGGQIQLTGTVTATSSTTESAVVVGGGYVQMGGPGSTFTVAKGPAAVDLRIDTQIRGTGLAKAGLGTMRIEGPTSNTYTGTTTASAGLLELNKTGAGALAVPANLTIDGGIVREVVSNQIADAAVVNVNAGGRFDLNGQSDTVGSMTVTGGTLATGGTTAGRLTAGNTSFNAAATLAMNLVGATTSDRITANGMVAVGGALQLNLATAVPLGTVITLIDNDGTDAVAGNFSGLPEGTLVVVGGQTFSISYAGGTGNDVVLTRVNPPQVASFRVNDGSVQRSMVTSLTVTFSSQVTLGPGAFTLVPQGGGTPVALSFTTAVVNGVTVATIAFPGATGGSLADGRYVLTTVAGQVRDLAGTPMAADRQDVLFRLFGDVNGDAAVNGLDLAEFRSAFGTTAGNPNYLSYLDQNGDGAVNGLDLAAFRIRFGTNLP